jgi:hypothetical protein
MEKLKAKISGLELSSEMRQEEMGALAPVQPKF